MTTLKGLLDCMINNKIKTLKKTTKNNEIVITQKGIYGKFKRGGLNE